MITKTNKGGGGAVGNGGNGRRTQPPHKAVDCNLWTAIYVCHLLHGGELFNLVQELLVVKLHKRAPFVAALLCHGETTRWERVQGKKVR